MTVRFSANTRARHHTAPGQLDELATLGVAIPTEVQAARDHLGAIAHRLKTEPTDVTHRRATLARLTADPGADIADLVAAEVAADTARNALLQASEGSKAALAHAIMRNADELLASIRAVVFDPALATITAAAAGSPTVTVTELLRTGQTKAARALADAPAAAEQILTAYRYRGHLYRGSDIDDLTCSRWENPDVIVIDYGKSHERTPLEYYIDGLRAGGRLWLGTYAEVDDASRKLAKEQHAKTQKAVDEYVDKKRPAVAGSKT